MSALQTTPKSCVRQHRAPEFKWQLVKLAAVSMFMRNMVFNPRAGRPDAVPLGKCGLMSAISAAHGVVRSISAKNLFRGLALFAAVLGLGKGALFQGLATK